VIRCAHRSSPWSSRHGRGSRRARAPSTDGNGIPGIRPWDGDGKAATEFAFYIPGEPQQTRDPSGHGDSVAADRDGPDYAVPHVSDTARVSDGVNGRAEIGPVGRGREMQGKNKWAEAGNLAHDVGKSPFITFFYIICIFILNSNSNLVLDFKFN
jgi:hypothetical protein